MVAALAAAATSTMTETNNIAMSTPIDKQFVPNGFTVIVVGGGPAGSAAALALRQKSWKVRLYKKRKERWTASSRSISCLGSVGIVSCESIKTKKRQRKKRCKNQQ